MRREIKLEQYKTRRFYRSAGKRMTATELRNCLKGGQQAAKDLVKNRGRATTKAEQQTLKRLFCI